MRSKLQPPRDPVHEWGPVPDGYEVVWEEDDRCRVATDDEHDERICRRPYCTRRPVLALRRRNGWWLYCDWHTYGRRIEDGAVYHRVLREVRS